MKIHGTAKGGAESKKDFGVAFGGGAPSKDYSWVDVQNAYNIDETEITRNANVAEGWNAYCLSTEGSPAATGLTISGITGGNASEYVAFTWLDGSNNPRGYSSGNWDENVMSYGFYFTDHPDEDGALVRINGVTQNCTSGCTGNGHTYTANSTPLKVVMTADDVKFYVDTTLVYTANSGTSQQPDASKTYYMIGSVYRSESLAGKVTGEMA